ncbi:cytochrome P450 2J4-like isoform X2 [Ambystoma mexicanum]|uniref:cytochrome P450 2J4-like isoform X2 n=1 Tax=Ambystoma mexicanum TaxID=8296 RepID=UPI0037E7259C
MVDLTAVLLALLVAFIVGQYVKLQSRRGQFPPGPTPLPIIGNLWNLRFELRHETLMQLAKTYGNVFTVWMGQTPMIVLNGCQTIRDALITHSEETIGRPTTPLIERFSGGKGVIFSSGHTWKQQRRFGLMTLRNLGLGKKSLERRIQNEAQHLVEFFALENGKALDPSHTIVHSVTNVITSIVFGYRFTREDKVFDQLTEANDFMTQFMGSMWARVSDDGSSTFDELNMIHLVVELFGAGVETTTTTLRWALLYMITQPVIQEKVQKELDAVLGDSQIIQYEDRKRLPYTNAVIHEVQRYSNMQSVGAFRQTVKETSLQGFNIKKGTIIIPNLSSSLLDPDHWEKPSEFNPGHFLDKEGNFKTNEAFLPFSAGHRVCLGELLARTELFIFFSSLMRAFTFRLPDGVKEVNMGHILGSTLVPYPYTICAIPR